MRQLFFWRQFWRISGYAVVGTAISTVVVAVPLYYLGQAGITPALSVANTIAFAGLISAVDPVATLSTFSSLGVNNTLFALVTGESMLNDAVAIVIFRVATAVRSLVDRRKHFSSTKHRLLFNKTCNWLHLLHWKAFRWQRLLNLSRPLLARFCMAARLPSFSRSHFIGFTKLVCITLNQPSSYCFARTLYLSELNWWPWVVLW